MGFLISDKFSVWQAECETRFQQLKANEEELNRIFIDIYGLQDELTPRWPTRTLRSIGFSAQRTTCLKV